MLPATLYAKSGDVNIAYQVVGEGPLDLVFVSGFVSHLDLDWGEPRSEAFLARLASFSRLIRFDKRGTGLSDRAVGLPDLETRMDDVRAVMDAVGSERAALFGYSEGGPMCILFAATYPRAHVEPSSCTDPSRSGATPTTTIRGRRRGRQRQQYAAATERRWGEDADMSRIAPRRRGDGPLVGDARSRGCQPGRSARV